MEEIRKGLMHIRNKNYPESAFLRSFNKELQVNVYGCLYLLRRQFDAYL